MIGRVQTLWLSSTKNKDYKTIGDVVQFLQEWAKEEMKLHPGTKYIIEE